MSSEERESSKKRDTLKKMYGSPTENKEEEDDEECYSCKSCSQFIRDVVTKEYLANGIEDGERLDEIINDAEWFLDELKERNLF